MLEDLIDRRGVLKSGLTMGMTGGALTLLGHSAANAAETQWMSQRFQNEGAGCYTDPSVANQISTFTINRSMVSCGVGTMANGQFSGPFAMLMYSLQIKSYVVDPDRGDITAKGKMRSITKTGGTTTEDVEHDFLAIAVDASAEGTDRFDVHFKTPFWNSDNPMATPSSEVEGGARFGGELLMGDVTIGQDR